MFKAVRVDVMKRCFTILLWLAASWCVNAQTNVFPMFRVETAREYLQVISAALPGQTGTNAETYWLQARVQNELGRKDAAERLAQLSLQLDPNRADVCMFLARLMIREDRLEEAAAALRNAVQIEPAITSGYSQLGMVLDRLGNRKKAEAAFCEAIRLNPKDGTARLLLGRLLLEQDQVKQAITELEEAARLDPESANPFYALSQAQRRPGDEELAEKALVKFQELKQKEEAKMDAQNLGVDNAKDLRELAASFHIGAAVLLGREGKEAKAQDHLRQAVQITPEEPKPYELLAELYSKNGQLAEARRMLETLTRLRPQQVTYGVNLGTLLLRLKEWPEATAELKRVLRLNPDEPAALNNLARYYLGARRELPEALAMSQRLVNHDPKAANYDLLGWALYANGKPNGAVAACREAVHLEPTNPVYKERYRRIREVTGPDAGNAK
jgi:superkiller protein 3